MRSGAQESERITLDAILTENTQANKLDAQKNPSISLPKTTETSPVKPAEKPVEKVKEKVAEVAEKTEPKKKSPKSEKNPKKQRKSRKFWQKFWQKTIRLFSKITPKMVIIFVLVLLALNLVVQIFYPSAKMLPGTMIAGQNFSFAEKTDVMNRLNESYSSADIDIVFGENELPYNTVKPSDIGLTLNIAESVDKINYPWYMRLVPTSLFWYGALVGGEIQPEISFSDTVLNTFITKEFGKNCSITPENASLVFEGRNLKLKKAKYGGTCKIDDVRSAIKNLSFDSASQAMVRIPMDTTAPDITNNDAKQLASALGTKLLKNLSLIIEDELNGGTIEVPTEELVKWIEFEVVDKKLTVVVSDTKSADFFNKEVAPLVSRSAGVSVVTANNLGSVDRRDGAEGKMINIKETNQRIADWLMDKRTSVVIAVESINPELQFARKFDSSSEGISAFITYFAQTHNGKYGVQVFEIGGAKRQASYYADREFNVGGAARFVVGYGILDSDTFNAQDEACFNSVMRSYNVKCVDKSVFTRLLQNKSALGLANTTINADSAKSTAHDLAAMLVMLYNGNTGLDNTGRNKILNAMQSSEPRSGIASLGSNVMSAVGSQDKQYSDVVLTVANGHPYVLAVLTENANKKDVIELGKKINELMGN